MAVYYTQEEPSFLEQMLSSGLQSYQQKKQQAKQGQALGNLAGLSEQQSKLLSSMSPEMQQAYISNLTKSNIANQKNVTKQREQQQLMQLIGIGDQLPIQQPNQQPTQGQGNLMQMLGMGREEQAQLQEPIQQPTEGQFNLGQSLGIQQPVQQPTQAPKRHTQDQINAATLINPNAGRAMQAQNDAVDKSIQEDRKFTKEERTETYKNNLPAYKETQTSIKKYKSEKTSLDQLKKLNSSDKLPKKLSININPKTGDLIIPALANAETQRYVKLINDFTTKAKDSYGARVTNFELDRFMKRLPTLSNSIEGREQILEQMDIINELNALKDQELKGIYDNYGLSNIDYQQANILAEQSASEKEAELIERMNNIGNPKTQAQQQTQNNAVNELPKAAKDGSIATDTKTGTKYKFSNGKWSKM